MKKQSYMEICIHLDGKENVYLRVPTMYDGVKKQWIGFIKTPETQRLISGAGKNARQMQDSFNDNLKEVMCESDEMGQEIFEMFMPAFYWEK